MNKTTRGIRQPKVNPDDIRRTFQLFHREGILEVRIPKCMPWSRGRFRPVAGYFDNPDDIVSALEKIPSWQAVYISLNEPPREFLSRYCNYIETEESVVTTSDADIQRRTSFFLDLDPIRDAHISASNAEHAEAFKLAESIAHDLHTRGFPIPAICDSGNGAHLVWAIDLPGDDGGKVTSVLKGMAALYADEARDRKIKIDASVGNASRIIKLYGTQTCKGSDTEERPHRMSRILSMPKEMQQGRGCVMTVEMMDEIASFAPVEVSADKDHIPRGTNGTLELETWLVEHGIEVASQKPYNGGTRYKLAKCIENEAHGNEAFVVQNADGSIGAGCPHDSCEWGWRDLREQFEPDCYNKPLQTRNHKAIAYRIMTAAKLDEATFSQTQFLVENIMASDQNLGILGGSKTLKTSVACDLAFSLATGVPFLRRFRVDQPCRVCMMSGESGFRLLQDTVRRICTSANRTLGDVEDLLFSDMLPQLDRSEHLVAIEQLLTNQAIKVLIIDPVYLAINGQGKESSMFAMGKVLRNVGEVCRDHGVTLCLCHHAKQSATRHPGKPDFRDAAFSGFEQFFAQWLCLSRREHYQPGTGLHKLWMRAEGRMGHSGLWKVDIDEGIYSGHGSRGWDVSIFKSAEAERGTKRESEQKKSEEYQTKVVDALRGFRGGETLSKLGNVIGMNHNRVRLAIETLISTGVVEPCTISKSNRKMPYHGFRLVATDQSKIYPTTPTTLSDHGCNDDPTTTTPPSCKGGLGW